LLDGSLELARHQVKKGYSKELIELVFQQPYCRIQSVEKAGLAKRETASAYLKELEWVGILRGVMIGREKYYLNDRLFSVLAE
jgi:Fic family protein